jgi:cellulose synthase/poly-beta-1,6-N-acetylglucosamine synthase-like glycosyltransferase
VRVPPAGPEARSALQRKAVQEAEPSPQSSPASNAGEEARVIAPRVESGAGFFNRLLAPDPPSWDHRDVLRSRPARQPAVSVVLPFRDAAPTLAAAIESIHGQTLADFECLLIDNGSKDESGAIARALCLRDARFRMLEASGNLVDALNAGIEGARSAWIARMDADDLALPRRLECQIALLDDDPSLSIGGCLVSCFPESNLRDGMRRYEAWLNSVRTPEEIRNAIFVESPLPHPTAVLSRAALLAVGGYRDTGGPEDYDLWLRLILGGYRAAKVPEMLLRWRDSPRRLSRVDPRYAPERFMETKLRYLPQVVPPTMPVQIWGAGPIGRQWAKELQTRGYRIHRFIDVDPRKIGRRARGVSVEPPSRLHPGDGFVLCAVGSPGAREKIETWLRGRGLAPWEDYLTVA